jgi:hypothetical protein
MTSATPTFRLGGFASSFGAANQLVHVTSSMITSSTVSCRLGTSLRIPSLQSAEALRHTTSNRRTSGSMAPIRVKFGATYFENRQPNRNALQKFIILLHSTECGRSEGPTTIRFQAISGQSKNFVIV